jgi:hypothetical protein
VVAGSKTRITVIFYVNFCLEPAESHWCSSNYSDLFTQHRASFGSSYGCIGLNSSSKVMHPLETLH